MSAKILSATLQALDAKIIEVEVDVAPGLPTTVIVGLADKPIKESKERVRACLKNSQRFKYPLKRISINLAPANIYKYGSQFDLSIAIGILLASGQVKFNVREFLFLGELSLSGLIRPISGALSLVLAAKAAGLKKVFLPAENLSEAALVSGIELVCHESLEEIIQTLETGIFKVSEAAKINYVLDGGVDFSEIADQDAAKRALEIAASGGHNVRLIGPPGSGKTMLAQSITSILPLPAGDKILEVVKIHGVTGALKDNKINIIPFRSPHHSISLQAFVGGGMIPRPGEISLAHNGVLFLDEFPEFPRNIIESLRQPLEGGAVIISRMQSNYIFPADFILIAAQNPCPCGYWQTENNRCVCSPGQIQKYKSKVSGPILDRIDLQIYVPKVSLQKINSNAPSSVGAAERVRRARQAQAQRLGLAKLNSRMSRAEIDKFCALDSSSKELIYAAENKYSFSARAYFKILKVARTIADLRARDKIAAEDIAEALAYRVLENFQ